jgi:cytochrome c oxidase subunit 4
MTNQELHTANETRDHSDSYARLIMIWFGLVALTGLTVALSGINLGRWIVLSALTIASIKSILVLNVFMHLKFEDRIFRIFVIVAGLTLAIFLGLIFADYAFT